LSASACLFDVAGPPQGVGRPAGRYLFNAKNTKNPNQQSYLKSARLEHGLLINFGSYKFEIRKYTWSEN